MGLMLVLRPSLLLLLGLAGLATTASAQCAPGLDFCDTAPGPGADRHGCCTSENPKCCDLGGGIKFCRKNEADCPFCPITAKPCTANFTTLFCVEKQGLCDDKCCMTDKGIGLCCGKKQCCQYKTSSCRKRRCTTPCHKFIHGKRKTKICKEPKFCCQGNCVDPVEGKKGLPCKGLCCDRNDILVQPFGPPAFPQDKINGLCCNEQCCIGNQTCCTGPDGTSCGIPCGGNKCCRNQQKCCRGECVDDNIWCNGQCCEMKSGVCCANTCCPEPQICCSAGSPFPGSNFGKCCGVDASCCSDGCCPKGKACNCGPNQDACCH